MPATINGGWNLEETTIPDWLRIEMEEAGYVFEGASEEE